MSKGRAGTAGPDQPTRTRSGLTQAPAPGCRGSARSRQSLRAAGCAKLEWNSRNAKWNNPPQDLSARAEGVWINSMQNSEKKWKKPPGRPQTRWIIGSWPRETDHRRIGVRRLDALPEGPIFAVEHVKSQQKVGDAVHDDAGAEALSEHQQSANHQTPDDRGDPLNVNG